MASGPVELRTIETNIPARMDRLPWAQVALARRHRPGRGVDPRRARGHDRRHDREPPDRGGLGHRADGVPDRHGRRDLRGGRVPRRAVLRPPRRPAGAQEAVHDHAGRLPRGHGRDRVLGLVPVLRGLPLLHRRRHRRRVRGDQLRDRRADPRARARHRRPDHQRLVLARHRGGRAALDRAARHVDLRRRRRLARRLRARRDPRRRHPARAPLRAGVAALAVHPRARRGGRGARPRHRAPGRASRPGRSSRSRAARSRSASAARSASAPSRRPSSSSTRSGPCSGLSLFIGQAFLYNSVFFTYALVLDKFYGVGANSVGFYIFAFAIGNFLGPLLLGRFFDSRRAQADDRRHLHPLRRRCSRSPRSCSTAGR